MRWIVESSLRLAVVVVVAVVLVLVVGVAALRHTPVDTLPELMPPQVQVQTEALGLSTAEVEQFITVPLEDEFNGLAYLDHLRSQSVPGLSSIELTFKPGTDIYKARQLVTERVAQGPSVVNVGSPPVMIQPLSVEDRALMIGLSSKSLSMIDLSTLARWRIRPRLLAVPGVANVTIWGQRDRQLQVLVDPARMARRGITLEQVINTTGDAMWTSPLTFVEASSPGADGFIDVPNQRLSIQHVLPIRTARDLAAVPVEDTTGPPVRLGDVSTVVEDHPALRGDAILQDGPGLLLVIEKFPGANALAVTRGVEAAMADLKPGLAGVTVDTTVFRPATYIETALREIRFALLASFLLFVVWLALSTWSARLALIGAVALVLPLVVAAGLLHLHGETFTLMTLAGLAASLGVVVDDAVIGIITLRRRLDRQDQAGRSPAQRAVVIAVATVDLRRPLVYTLAVIALGAVPFLLLGGVRGALVRPLGVALLLAVAAAALTALTAVPALGQLLLRPARRKQHGSGVARRIEAAYARLAPRLFARRGWAWAAVALLAAAGGFALSQLGTGPFVPALQDRDLLVRWQAAPGTSLLEMRRESAAIDAALRATPGVRASTSEVGQALMGDQVVDVDSAETWVRLDRAVDYGAGVAAVRRAVAGFAGLRATVATYAAATLDGATSRGAPLTVRIYGDDQQDLAASAQRVRRTLLALHGVVAAHIRTGTEEPAVVIATDVAAAARHGLKPGDVRRQTSVLLAGIPVGSYYQQQQQIYDVTVWSEPVVREDAGSLGNLPLDTPGGGHVPLHEVASVRIAPVPTEIKHDQVSRYLDVTAVVRGASLGPVVAAVRQRVQSLPLPLGYHIEVFSDLQQRQSADARLLLEVCGVLAAVLLLLQAALQSWGRAVLLLVSLPLALAGAALAAWGSGPLVSAGGIAGLVVVASIALRNGLLLLRRLRRREREHPGGGGSRVIAEVTAQTVYPVIVSAVGLALVVAPFVVRGTVPGVEVLRPLGIVVAGGLVTSTLYSLFVLPFLYLRLVAPAPPASAAPEREGRP